jgi:hypothetical protein
LGNSLKSTFSSFAGPLFGAGIGAQLGGQSVAGQILGSAGGIAGGIATASILAGAKAGVSGIFGSALGLGAAAGPLALAAAPALIIGSILLGKAKQRRADERVVDTYWVEYSRVLKELTAGVNSDRINGDDALSQAAEARQTAVGLIGQIKTKSVRESRLRNQIPQIDAHDLRNLQNAVAEQRTRLADQSASLKRRSDLDSRLYAEFSSGGVIGGAYGSRQALIGHAGEVILNARQRAAIGDDELAAAGVPGVRGGAGGTGNVPPIVVINEMGTQTQDRLFINGMRSHNTKQAHREALANLRYA